MNEYSCSRCKSELSASDAYEYRGAVSCSDCFDAVIDSRNHQRNEIIEEENRKTEVFKGLDLSPDTPIGKANREILKPQLEIASKESARLREYERGTAKE